MTAQSSHAVLPLALVAGSMVLTVAACGGSTATSPTPSSAGQPTATVTATTTEAASATPSGSASASASASGTPGTGGSGCAVADLRIRYADDPGGAGAGSVMGTFTFTNTGATACTLTGFPGVSYVGGGNGTQVGQPAARTDDAVKAKTLAAGSSAKAALRRTQPRNYGSACQLTKVDGFRVYPPNSTESALVSFKTTGCKSTSAPLLQAGPVR